MKKFMQLEKWQRIFFLSLGFVAFLAFVDFSVYRKFPNPQEPYFWSFWLLVYGFLVLFGLVYYYIVKHDKSEAIAIPLSALAMIWFGLEDVLFYWLRFMPIPPALPWLDTHFIMGKYSSMLGFTGVTNVFLVLSAATGVLLSYQILKYSRRF